MILRLIKTSKENKKLKMQNELYRKQLNKFFNSNLKLSKEIENQQRKTNSAKGGFISKINKLEARIKELEEKLKESMTDKYIVKKIPSGRPPKQERMKIKNCTKTSMISKKMHRDK